MTKAETKKLLMYLELLFPTKKFKDPELIHAAWSEVLAGYDYAEVKDNATKYASQNKFFPDIADLTAGLKTAPVVKAYPPNADLLPGENETQRIYRLMEKI